jgi:GNAT superfamily N-acetyltransferase
MLWYLAVSERLRGHGAGSNLYLEILNRVRNEFPSAAGLVFEVERPDQAQTAELGALAERRIRFYQRNGALLLEGVHYVQCTGWQPEVAMHLMVHPFITMSALAAFDLCSSVFGDSLCAAGDLSLVAAD